MYIKSIIANQANTPVYLHRTFVITGFANGATMWAKDVITLKTRITELLAIEVPIIQGGLTNLAYH